MSHPEETLQKLQKYGGVLLNFPRVWRTLHALALVPDIAVIPHFDEIPSFITSMLRSAARKTTIAGIDGSTALVGTGGQWTVLGKGKVTLFSEKSTTRYLAGDRVPLQKNRGGKKMLSATN